MTKITPEQYNQLREKIIEAVPEIVELKFGCEIKFKNGENEKGVILQRVFADYEEFNCDYYKHDHYEVFDESDDVCEHDIIEIIGRPIALCDVFIAYDKDHHIMSEYPKIATIVNIWNLQNNSLEWHYLHQPKTVKFLFDLLVQDGSNN